MPADSLTSGLGIAFIVAVVCAVILGWLCYRLLVDRGHLLLRVQEMEGAEPKGMPPGVPPGSYLADFALPRLDGSMATLSGLIDRPLLLVFVRGECLFSRALMRELGTLGDDASGLTPVPIVVGEVSEAQIGALSACCSGEMVFDGSGQVARVLRVAITPAGYRVDQGRRTIGPLLTGPAALLAAARGEDESETAATLPMAVTPIPKAVSMAPLAPGDAAPRFTLPTLAGAPWALEHAAGAPVRLVFTDPGCPPCRTLLAELSRREIPDLVLVSRGDLEENRRLGEELALTAPVLVQQQREVARAFGTLETPAAYAIDARGAIAAGPAIGAEEVLMLVDERLPAAAGGQQVR